MPDPGLPGAGPVVWGQGDVAVDDEQVEVINFCENRAHWRQFAPVELAWLIRSHVPGEHSLLGDDR
jgi:hypothetical protein